MKECRKEIRREAGVGPETMFVPQRHLPGMEAEVDFGDVRIALAGVPTRVCLFTSQSRLRLRTARRHLCHELSLGGG